MSATVKQEGEWRFPVENSFVRDASISVEARLLFIILRGYVGPGSPQPFPSIFTLSKHMDRHRESIQKYLNELWCAGYIEKEHAKKDGKFTSTRYTLFDRAGKKPLRKLPATEKSASISTQYKEVSSVKGLSETKEVINESAKGFADDDLSFPPKWIPDSRTKEQKLEAIRPPKKYPSLREFDAFCESEPLDEILAKRGTEEIYHDLCLKKWRKWDGKNWRLIRDWKAFVTGLNTRMEEATRGGF